MKTDLAALKASLNGLVEKIHKFPPLSASSADISERFDATAYVKTKAAKDALDNLARRASEFGDLDLALDMPKAIGDKVVAIIAQVQKILQEIEHAVRKQKGNEVVQRNGDDWFDGLPKRIEKEEGQLVELLLPWKQKASAEMVAVLNEASARAKETENKLAAVEEAASQIQRQLEAKTKEAAATVLSEVNIQEIDSSIAAHETSARYWLIAFVGAGLLAFRLIIWMFSEGDNLLWPTCLEVRFKASPTDPTLAQAVMSSIGKLVIASFTFGLLLITSRIYQTHAHNAIVNRHRRAAFISYQKLYSVIKDDPDSRQILVQQAATAIFGHTATGFLQKGSQEFGMSASILQEGLKAIRTPSSSS